jgi:hypothetical protein
MNVDLKGQPAPLQGIVGHPLVDAGGRIVYQNLDGPSQAFNRLGDNRTPLISISDVSHDHRDIGAVGTNAICRFREASIEMVVLVQCPGDESDIGTLRSQSLGDSGTDSSTGPRNHRTTRAMGTHY